MVLEFIFLFLGKSTCKYRIIFMDKVGKSAIGKPGGGVKSAALSPS
jgi:hypothetical protein